MKFLLNQYSFVTISILIILAAGIILLGRQPKWKDFLAFGVIATALIFAWTMLHPRQTPLMNDARLVKEMIGSGKPVLLEFQSPY